MQCTQCGYENLEHAKSCVGCGHPFVSSEDLPPPAQPLTPEDLEELANYTPTVYSKLQWGQTVSQTISIYFRNFVPFFLITLVAYSPVIIVGLLSMFQVAQDDATSDLFIALLTFAGIIVAVLAVPFATSAMTFGVLRDLRRRSFSVSEALTVGLKVMLTVFLVALLQGLAVAAGSMLCLIPGIIVAVMLSVSVPVAVEERPGALASLNRSSELTKGQRGEIFMVLFSIGVPNFGLAFAISMLGTWSPLISWALDTIRGILYTGISATAAAYIYYQLRSIKESLDIDEMASVFD